MSPLLSLLAFDWKANIPALGIVVTCAWVCAADRRQRSARKARTAPVTAESQQAGIAHLIAIAGEQAGARAERPTEAFGVVRSTLPFPAHPDGCTEKAA